MNKNPSDDLAGRKPPVEDAAPVSPAGSGLEAELQALRQRNEALETELAALRRQQDMLAYGLSHDLRGPMRAIDGFAQQLDRRCRELVPETDAGRQHLERIRGAVSRMGGLVDSLVEYSQVGRGQPRFAEVDMSFLADWTLMDLRDTHPGLDVQAEVDPGLRVAGDERLLKSLLGKLADNSRKFLDPIRGLRLKLKGAVEAGQVHLQWIDEGIGMALRDPQQPFEPFVRLHTASQGAGDGLGLAIAQAITQRHGGRIWAESAEGAGTTMHLLLPRAA